MTTAELKNFAKDVAEFPCPHCGQTPELDHIKGCFFRRVHCANADCDVKPMTDWWGYRRALIDWCDICTCKTEGFKPVSWPN